MTINENNDKHLKENDAVVPRMIYIQVYVKN